MFSNCAARGRVLFYAAMEAHPTITDLRAALEGCATLDPTLTLTDPAAFRDRALDRLVYSAVFAQIGRAHV